MCGVFTPSVITFCHSLGRCELALCLSSQYESSSSATSYCDVQLVPFVKLKLDGFLWLTIEVKIVFK